MLWGMSYWPLRLLFLGLLPAVHADEARPLLDQMPQSSIQSAFQILRRDYIRRDDLTFVELNRAALQGLLERLDFGAELVAKGGEAKKPTPSVHAEFLAPGIGYLRPGSFAEGEAALFEKALVDLCAKKMEHLIVDLRVDTMGTFEEAALMLQCFLPNGEVMFKLKQLGEEQSELFISRRDPVWKESMTLLLDGQSGTAAETMAACLQAVGKATIIGEKTRGATVRYAEISLDDKTALRYASAEMVLADGTSLFRKGLEPTFAKKLSSKDKAKIFAESSGRTMMPYVVDKVRPRFNEKALVQDSNPELDDYVRKSKGEALPGDEGQLRDLVAQRALDLLIARDLLAAGLPPSNTPPAAQDNE